MPRSASWLGRIDEIAFRSQIYAVIDRSRCEMLLGVDSRRAQQIMADIPGRETIGGATLVPRDAFIDRLRAIASGQSSAFEADRRARFAAKLAAMRRERIEQPQLLVEAPVAVVNTRIDQLPAGVTIDPGRITVSCDSATQALERLLALCMAIGNDPDKFSQLVEPS